MASPEVNPVAPTAKYPGAESSASPAIQTNRPKPASRATDANRTGSGTAYLTPMTFGATSPSARSCSPVMAELRT